MEKVLAEPRRESDSGRNSFTNTGGRRAKASELKEWTYMAGHGIHLGTWVAKNEPY